MTRPLPRLPNLPDRHEEAPWARRSVGEGVAFMLEGRRPHVLAAPVLVMAPPPGEDHAEAFRQAGKVLGEVDSVRAIHGIRRGRGIHFVTSVSPWTAEARNQVYDAEAALLDLIPDVGLSFSADPVEVPQDLQDADFILIKAG